MDLRGAFKPAVSALRSLLGLNGVAAEIHAVHLALAGLGQRLNEREATMRTPEEPAAARDVPASGEADDGGPWFTTLRMENGRTYQLSVDDPARRDEYHQAIATGSYDVSLRFLNDWIRKGDVFFDLGANIGTISIPAAVNGANVHAFELLDANVAHLARSVRKNALQSVSIVLGAVSDREEFVGIGGVSAWGTTQKGAMVSIPAVVIDSYARAMNIKAIDVMKIDVEGSEMKALGGAAGVIGRDHPDVVIECNAWTCGSNDYSYRDILRFFEARGYRLYRILAGREMWQWSSDLPQEVICTDYLATMKSPAAVLGRAQWTLTERTPEKTIQNILDQQYSSVHHHHLLALEEFLPPAVRESAVIQEMIARYRDDEDGAMTAVLRIGSA